MVPFLSDTEGVARPDFVGRDELLAAIDGHLVKAVEQGESQLVIVQGDRGLGKTTLCEAVAGQRGASTWVPYLLWPGAGALGRRR